MLGFITPVYQVVSRNMLMRQHTETTPFIITLLDLIMVRILVSTDVHCTNRIGEGKTSYNNRKTHVLLILYKSPHIITIFVIGEGYRSYRYRVPAGNIP